MNRKPKLAFIIFLVLCTLLTTACFLSEFGEVISQPFEDMVSGLKGMLSGLGGSIRQMFEGFSSPF